MAICPQEHEASLSSLNVISDPSSEASEEEQAMRKPEKEEATTSAPNMIPVTNVISPEPEMTPPAPTKRRVNGRTEGGIVRLNVG